MSQALDRRPALGDAGIPTDRPGLFSEIMGLLVEAEDVTPYERVDLFRSDLSLLPSDQALEPELPVGRYLFGLFLESEEVSRDLC